MLYSDKIKKAVRKIPVPTGNFGRFAVDIVEFDNLFLMLRFYSSQWYAMSESEREMCGVYLQNVQSTINSYGVEVTLDAVLGAPPK